MCVFRLLLRSVAVLCLISLTSCRTADTPDPESVPMIAPAPVPAATAPVAAVEPAKPAPAETVVIDTAGTPSATPAQGIQLADPSTQAPKGPSAADFVKRTHLHIDNQQAEADFVRLVRGKNGVLEDVAALDRLTKEKHVEIAEYVKGLLEEFSIQPDRQYHYDRRTMTIYDLFPTSTNVTAEQEAQAKVTPGVGATIPSPRKVHMVLPDKNKAADFVRLMSSKRLAAQQVEILDTLLREKGMELAAYDGMLLEKFSISRDRKYQYDSQSKTLFELIPVPEGSSVTEPSATP